MKRLPNPLKKFTNWLVSFTKTGVSEYQLNKYFVPEHQELERAHQLLLKEYVRAIAAVSRLSFFIGLHEIQVPPEGFIRRLFHLLLFKYSPLRLLQWKPLVQLFVEAHVRQKISQLSTIYIQTSFLIQNSLSEKPEYLTWLNQASQECKEFQQTLSTGKIFLDSLKFTTTFMFGLFLAFAGANSLNEFLQKLISNSLPPIVVTLFAFTLIMLIVVAPYIYLFWDSTFAAKRAIFMGIGSEISQSHNIYVLENNLFDLLGRGKPKEVPIDYIFQSLFFLSGIIFFWWTQTQFEKAFSATPNTIILPCFSGISVLLFFPFFTDVLLPWYKRYTQGYM